MKDYILSIVAAGIICAVVNCLISEKSPVGKIVKMLTGILMCITIIAPISDISFSYIDRYFKDVSADADALVEEGRLIANNDISDIIKAQTEAYILDKAKSMGLDISVEVELDDHNNSVPCGVTIDGPISPYIKNVMEEYIEKQLGITKENQRWI